MIIFFTFGTHLVCSSLNINTSIYQFAAYCTFSAVKKKKKKNRKKTLYVKVIIVKADRQEATQNIIDNYNKSNNNINLNKKGNTNKRNNESSKPNKYYLVLSQST